MSREKKWDVPEFTQSETIETLDEASKMIVTGGFHDTNLFGKNWDYAHIEIISADAKTGSSVLIRLFGLDAEHFLRLLKHKIKLANAWNEKVQKRVDEARKAAEK